MLKTLDTIVQRKQLRERRERCYNIRGPKGSRTFLGGARGFTENASSYSLNTLSVRRETRLCGQGARSPRLRVVIKNRTALRSVFRMY